MRKNSGFTLIELMIVIAIIATVLAITVPAYLTYIPAYRLNSAVEELQGSMQIARVRAIKEAASVCVSVDTGTETCTVFLDNGGPDGTGTADSNKQEGTEATIKILTMPRGIDIYDVTFTSNNNVARFNSRGLPPNLSYAGAIRLRTGLQGRYRAVVVNIAGRPAIRTSKDNGTTWN